MIATKSQRSFVFLPILVWWSVFVGLSFSGANPLELLNIIGFPFLILVPGFLTLLIARLKIGDFWGYLATVVGVSLLELMLLGLLLNTALPLLHVAHPLTKGPLLAGISILVGALLLVAWRRMETLPAIHLRYLGFERLRDAVVAYIPLLFVGLSIFGAIRLNNGASNILTMAMLGGVTLYLSIVSYASKNLGKNVLTTALFFIALALLFMTSLRGWYVTGHDIQSEYRVFELAKNSGIWNIAAYRDAYNACMSITILPTIFANLLRVPDPYVYKILFQVIFALSAPLVFLIGREWVTKQIALLGAIFFIGFPTFFTDMPFLNRQEVAFLFYGLMLYLVYRKPISMTTRRLLFVCMGVGVVLAHYSTTYTILLIFGLVVVARPFYLLLAKKMHSASQLRDSGIEYFQHKTNTVTIEWRMVTVLVVTAVLWTQIITQTGGSVVSVLRQTFVAVRNGFEGNNRSIDAKTLFSFSAPDQNEELQDYINNTINPIRKKNPELFYDSGSYEKYHFTALGNEKMPLTNFGEFLGKIGINGPAVAALLGQIIAKLMEVLVPAGVLFVLIRRQVVGFISNELFLISLVSLLFISLTIVLPVLSTQYGIYRAMQQSMFLIGPILAIGGVHIFILAQSFWRRCRRGFFGLLGVSLPIRTVSISAVTSRTVLVLAGYFFAFSTSLATYLIGGGSAVLHLSNSGNYYNNYLIQTTEVYGVDWLTRQATQDAEDINGVRIGIQTDRYSNNKFASLTNLNAYNDIFPGVIRRDGYVFIGPGTTQKGRAIALYNADQVAYAYPVDFLRDKKNLVYSNSGVEVYR
jgi:uncharacterized membrane protein